MDKGDLAQDKALIKKAIKQHDKQEHKGGKGTTLKLKKGGAVKKADGGSVPLSLKHVYFHRKKRNPR